jgi:hypothetical protein
MSKLVPLYGFVKGDTMGVLVLAHDDMPIGRVGKLLGQSASIRVDTRGQWRVYAGDRALDPERTVLQERLQPLDRIDLRRCPT